MLATAGSALRAIRVLQVTLPYCCSQLMPSVGFVRTLVYLPAESFSSTWSVPLRDLKPWLRPIQRLRFAKSSKLNRDVYTHFYTMFQIITGAVDSHLNADKYIVPGLGDYGDRFPCLISLRIYLLRIMICFGRYYGTTN